MLGPVRGSPEFFRDRNLAISELNYNDIVKDSCAYKFEQFFIKIWRAIVESFDPGYTVRKLRQKVIKIEELLNSDEYAKKIEDFKGFTRLPFLAEWKKNMLDQRNKLKNKIIGFSAPQSELGFVSSLVSKVEKMAKLQAKEALTPKDLESSYLNFVSFTLKEKLVEEKQAIEDLKTEILTNTFFDVNKKSIDDTHSSLFKPLLESIKKLEDELTPKKKKSIAAKDRAEEIHKINLKMNDLPVRRNFTWMLCVFRTQLEIFKNTYNTSKTDPLFEAGISDYIEKCKDLRMQLNNFNETMLSWIILDKIPKDLKNCTRIPATLKSDFRKYVTETFAPHCTQELEKIEKELKERVETPPASPKKVEEDKTPELSPKPAVENTTVHENNAPEGFTLVVVDTKDSLWHSILEALKIAKIDFPSTLDSVDKLKEETYSYMLREDFDRKDLENSLEKCFQNYRENKNKSNKEDSLLPKELLEAFEKEIDPKAVSADTKTKWALIYLRAKKETDLTTGFAEASALSKKLNVQIIVYNKKSDNTFDVKPIGPESENKIYLMREKSTRFNALAVGVMV